VWQGCPVPARSRPDDRADQFFEVSAGERTVPGIWHENYWLRRHEVVYEHVGELVDQVHRALGRAPVVLDAGCGEGYGTTMLAVGDTRTLALDYDAWTAQHLAIRYPDLPALRANLVGLPLRDRSVDVLVSLQTIEHLWDQPRFVTECARVLRPGGLLVLSTPNRHTFPPGNVFHHRELDADELGELLTPTFDAVEVLGVHHGPRLRAWERQHGGIVDAQLCRPPHEWSQDLASTVAGIGTDDFVVDVEVATCLDLLATALAR
jgi:SAM-dependent methyltransferase